MLGGNVWGAGDTRATPALQASGRAVHVAHDDGDVLEPAVVALHCGRRAARMIEVLPELDPLAAKRERDDPDPPGGDAGQLVPLLAADRRVTDRAEGQQFLVEAAGPVDVGNGQRHAGNGKGNDAASTRGLLLSGDGDATAIPRLGVLRGDRRRNGQQRRDQECPLHARRSSRWSPTRSALAMMVSAGFTAALEGKQLPSTT